MTNKRRTIKHLPIVYHAALAESFAGWADAWSYLPSDLRRDTEWAIRMRHHQAVISHEAHWARGRQPNIWQLDLGSVRVIYTVEEHAIVIRGYSWDIEGEPLDDFDGGGHYSEFDWHSID